MALNKNPSGTDDALQAIFNSDGTPVAQRKALLLPASLVATDNAEKEATVLALSTALTALAPLAARSVIGNSTGSTATPTALPATAAGLSMLAAADATAQTALLDVAGAAKGLLAAADKAALDTMPRRIADATYSSATSITIPFTANAYRKIIVSLDWDGGGINSVALTGMAAGTFEFAGNYAASSGSGGFVGGHAANNWAIGTGAGATSPGAGELTFDLPAAPRKKFLRFAEADGFIGSASIVRHGAGYSTDTTNNPTAIVITFDAARSGGYTVYGCP